LLARGLADCERIAKFPSILLRSFRLAVFGKLCIQALLGEGWWNELTDGKDGLFRDLSPDERQSLLKLFALDYLTCHAQAVQKRIPSIEEVSGKCEYAPGEEERLREMVAAGVGGVCYKGGEMHPARL
jgi:hypothetical protein